MHGRFCRDLTKTLLTAYAHARTIGTGPVDRPDWEYTMFGSKLMTIAAAFALAVGGSIAVASAMTRVLEPAQLSQADKLAADVTPKSVASVNASAEALAESVIGNAGSDTHTTTDGQEPAGVTPSPSQTAGSAGAGTSAGTSHETNTGTGSATNSGSGAGEGTDSGSSAQQGGNSGHTATPTPSSSGSSGSHSSDDDDSSSEHTGSDSDDDADD